MIEGRASRTALRVAMHRAAHQLVDRPKVFDDPLATKVIGPRALAKLKEDLQESKEAASMMRAFMAVRSRFAEDRLAQAVEQGVTQYVVLGAGLDTFAYRNPYAALRVFEVDFPATQAWKREMLQAAEIRLPQTLTFAPVDFEKQTLEEGLRLAGFCAGEPAFFSWLGVTPYLKTETTLQTLRTIILLSGRNGVAFDYMVPRESLEAAHQKGFDALANRVAAVGEPFQGFFVPHELAKALRGLGFGMIEDLGAEEIDARYFRDRFDGLRVGGKFGRLLLASGNTDS
jgi:methyltransferase (TIGR00027 family)